MAGDKMRPITTSEEVDEALESQRAIILKHSTQCPISRFVRREVASFMAERPEVPVYIIDVLQNRDASRHLAEKTRIRHQSPQAFVIEGGAVKWHQSHYSVDAAALRKQIS